MNDSGNAANILRVPAALTLDHQFLIEITDADEEIFDLYSRLAGWDSVASSSGQEGIGSSGHTSRSGLGFLDPSTSSLTLELEINSPGGTVTQTMSPGGLGTKRKGRSQKPKPKPRLSETRLITAELHQDIYAINYRKGDTGSVVWRATIDLAELLWYDLLHPLQGSLLDMRLFVTSLRILELGSGTGALAVLCKEMFPSQSTTRWIVSDQSTLLPMVSRNFNSNGLDYIGDRYRAGRYQIEELDWIEVEKDWLKANSNRYPESDSNHDLILAVDCLYNECLVLPLIHTLDHLAKPQSSGGTPATLVLIVCQLRSDEVMRLFIERWIGLRSWKIYRVNGEGLRLDLNLNLSDPGYVIWCGWKVK